ncbi:prorelaxin H1 isoform X2 [Paramormyrops kingsleyae]|uniref:prorelaxin H1 isoform X2 n=1 Tax=Paramormyrops kingsleyae TaxID=1676925 RepID=UPI000CD63BA8|nr:prorelaxin H1 isoform X2 [Paramormyrops kingsleyae]
MLRLMSVILLSLCLSGGAQGVGGGAALVRDYGVKLCGREFIRAVIFTCGGSRWRRTGAGGGAPFPERPYSDPSDTEGNLSWPQAVSAEHPNRPAFSLLDVLNVLGISNDRDPEEALDSNEIGVSQARSRSTPWAYPNRRKRNFSLGLAGMCCNLGCTKNDIGRLC